MGKLHANRGRKSGRRDGGVRGRAGRLGRLIQKCLEEWGWIEEKFLTKVFDGCYALKMQELGHEEEFQTTVLAERETVILYEVTGYNKARGRKRPLGYCFLYLGNPIVHDHTWYLAVCYSDPTQVSQKDWVVLYADHNVRLVRVGIGDIDYMFAYRGKTAYHDEQGYSDGAVRLETASNWKDGL